MSDKNTKVVPLTEEQLQQKEAELQQFEAKLNADVKTFEAEKAMFEAIKEIFETEKSELEETKSALEKQKADLEELEKNLLEAGTDTESVEAEPGFEFTYKKEKYKFKDDAPKEILLEKGKMTQEEIAADEKVLLTVLNGSLIQKL